MNLQSRNTANRSPGSLSQKWIKAAAIGSIWAAFEIIAGSFLHNLRIPFSGTILSIMVVFMLVGFAMHWPDRGIIIRAGLITAIMKSVSPSAIILGPMVGIFMESFILEMTWFLIGRNIAGFIIGGILAVSWALVQKVLNLLILYGFDLVRIADALYNYLVSLTGFEEMKPVYLILLVLSLYALGGTLAAIAGFRAYKRAVQSRAEEMKELQIDENAGPFSLSGANQRYTAINLLFIVLAFSFSLFFLNRDNYIPALLTGGSIISFALIRYRNSVRHLKKAGIWIQLIIITLLATFIWEWIQTGNLFSSRGLVVGLEMNFRAMVVIFSFSAISVELRNPLVRSLLYRYGLSNLYKSISLAFLTLPVVIDRMPQIKNIIRQRKTILSRIFILSETLLAFMNKGPLPHHNIFIITGKVQSGKTTCLNMIIKILRKNQLKIAGFTATGTFKNNRRDTFIFTDIESERSLPLASVKKEKGWFRYRRFYFNPFAFEKGSAIITEALTGRKDAIIIDEIGPMELAGSGWHKCLAVLDNNYDIPQIWVVREGILKEVRERFQIPEHNIFPAGSCKSDELVESLLNLK